MPLRKVMHETSLNDFNVWMQWLDDQWDNPTLTDYYLMSVAQSIWQVNSENPNSVKLNSFKLNRKDPGKMTEEQIAQNLQMTLSLWTGILGGNNASSSGIDFSQLKLKAWT